MTGQPLFTDGTVTLRAVEPDDIDALLAWENDSREWASATTAAPFSRHNIEEYVLSYDADIFASRQLRLMIDTNAGDRAVGAVDLFDFDPVSRRAGIGIVIDRRFRRRGYAVAALAVLARYCRVRLGMHQLWAIVQAGNAPSRAMLAAAGYTTSGRLRSWIRNDKTYDDAYVCQRLL